MSESPSSVQVPRSKILLVDDHRDNIELLQKILKPYPYDLKHSLDGTTALQVAEEWVPDLILLDIMLPRMNGYEVCAQLAQNPKTAEVPVIFVTAKSSTEDIVEGFKKGGVDYVTKPFRRAELTKRIETHLKLRHATLQLQRANNRLERQNLDLLDLIRKNRELISMAAHDLKNPINGIANISRELISMVKIPEAPQDADVSEDTLIDDLDKTGHTLAMPPVYEDLETQLDFLNMIGDASRDMLGIIENLMTSESLESGMLTIDKSLENINDLIEGCLEMNRANARAKDISLQLDRPEEDIYTVVDPGRYREMVDNLVSNAIKYSPMGSSVSLVLETRPAAEKEGNGADDDTHVVALSIQDQGPGFTTEDLQRIFGRFQKLSARPTGDESSTGLGLSIVKQLAELHDGSITAENGPSGGALFTLQIPLVTDHPDL